MGSRSPFAFYQLKAVGSFSDDSKQDLTSLVDWASNNASFAATSSP